MALVAVVSGRLAESSAEALEWGKLREHIAGRASSELGRAWVVSLEACADAAWIDAQQQRTAEVREFLRGGGSFEFAGMFDGTSLLDQARVEGSALEGAEILRLQEIVERLARWRKVVRGERREPLPVASSQLSVGTGRAPAATPDGDGWASIRELSQPVVEHDFTGLLEKLRGKIEPDGSLSDDASHELRRIRRAMERQHRAIEESLRKSLRALKEEGSAQDELITVRGERFVIPVKAEFRKRVPGVVHGSSSSGQTVFVEPLDTIEQNNEMQRLLDEEQREIRRILVAMTHAIGAEADAIAAGTEVLAEVESHFARAKWAEEFACVRPVVSESAGGLNLVKARHPLLELRLRREGGAAVPITVELTSEARQLILSGPNTGGKTVSLKTIGLLALMAQAGLPVPADQAELPMFHAIYADIGDAQSIESNLSSFSAHVKNVDHIARAARDNSLALLDELGSATDPEEGAALAVAVAAHFLEVRAWTCITTHLTALKVYAANRPGVLNAAVGFDQARLAPTYEVRMGVPGASAGLNIAERLGLLAEIVTAARTNLSTQTQDIGELLDQLHRQLTESEATRAELAREQRELTRERMRLETEGRTEQKARTKELEAKLNTLIGDFEWQMREAVKAVDDKAAAQRLARDSAVRIARLRREFGEQFNQTVVAHQTGADRGAAPSERGLRAREEAVHRLKAGDRVRLKSLGREAVVERLIDAKSVYVAVGTMKMRVGVNDIAEVTPMAVVTPLDAARRRGGITVQTVSENDTVPMEINVIGRTADEAQDEVARYIDRAFLAGLPRVRIVHGTGMGILRRTLRDYLKGHPHVAGVTEPPHNEGGQGATEVELRS